MSMCLKSAVGLQRFRLLVVLVLVSGFIIVLKYHQLLVPPENAHTRQVNSSKRLGTPSPIHDLHRSMTPVTMAGLKETEEEKERRFYDKFLATKTDHCDFKFIANGLTICEDQMPYLLIMIPSSPHYANIRQVIRETWGQYIHNTSLPKQHKSMIIKLAFLLGIWNNDTTKKELLAESRTFNDLVIGDFKDSYRNLTRKVLFGLKWMSIYCAEADYVLKADDDIYVDIPRLLDVLKVNPANLTGSIYGHLYNGGTVMRNGRWAVSRDQYPLVTFPAYMSGTAYVLSGNIPSRLLMTSQHLPYIPIEDVFITGILAKVNEISLIDVNGFTHWREDSPDPCTFLRTKKIAANKVDSKLMRLLWSTQQNKLCHV